MSLRHLKVLFWIAGFLLLFELALEVRATRRGWETLVFGGTLEEAEDEFGPTDDFPFRSRIVPAERSPGVLRVWTSSSSYGADELLTPPELFPNLLAEELAAAGREVETFNCSVDGYSITDNVDDLREHGPAWRPEVVVLYQMSNDVNWISSGLDSGETLSVGAGESAAEPNRIQRLVEETTAYKNLKTQVTSRLTKARLKLDSIGAEGALDFEARVRGLIEAARDLGAQPVLCTFATSHVRASLDELPAEYELNLLRFNIHLGMEGWLDSIDRCNRVLERLATEEGLPLVDVAAELSGRSEHFRDFWHMRVSGHQIVARLIAAELVDLEGPGQD